MKMDMVPTGAFLPQVKRRAVFTELLRGTGQIYLRRYGDR